MILPNEEKYDRKWLVYSKDLDKVYYFCCKLFCSSDINQLVNEGTRDWKNLSSKLKSHDTSHEDISNLAKWIELEKRFKRKKSIDKNLHE